MARILLAAGEDLVAMFRPHVVSFAPRFLLDLLWYVHGLAATMLAWRFEDVEFLQSGAFVFAILAFAQGILAQTLRRRGLLWSLVWAALGVTVGVLALLDYVPVDLGWLYALGLGLAASLLLVARTETVRRRRNYHLTDRRLVIAEGVRRRTERGVDLTRIESVHGQQGIGGQMFGYGTVTLVLAKRPNRKGEEVPREEIPGVPRYQKTKHALELAVSEARLSPRERAKRVEERRLRESMHAVASWVRRDKA